MLSLLSTMLAACLHVYIREPWPERASAGPVANLPIESVSYNPSSAPFDSYHPDRAGTDATRAEIDRDLTVISRFSRGVRTYGVGGPLSDVPVMAAKHGLFVDLGVAVDEKSPETTRRELDRAIRLANGNGNVRRLYVGNETLVRHVATADQLIELLKEARRRTGKPVTTGETWDNWLGNPRLAGNVDLISAHILPFWEGVPADHAVASAFGRYLALRHRFPRAALSIGEFGWPSQGSNHLAAWPGAGNQASVLRSFVREAERRGVDYNIVEAKDQPWKVAEGDVGQNWGVLYADGQPKFCWTGPLPGDPAWPGELSVGLVIGLAITLAFFVVHRPTRAQALLSGPVSQGFGYLVAPVFVGPFERYVSDPDLLPIVIFCPLLALLVLLTADRMREAGQRLLGAAPRHLFVAGPIAADVHGPFVSIHVPVCNEAYDVVGQTLTSLSRLDWDRYEVVVILNNYRDAALAGRIADLCASLGARFVFVDLPAVAGFKAGAMNRALQHTSPRATVIGVVDADYVVCPSWLRRTVGAFEQEDVASVQVPQDHRLIEPCWWQVAMNTEYGSFFDIGMVQRHEHNAIISHGTMLLLRRSAFDAVGGWDETCITEDTELGLRLLLAGWRNVYTTERLGAGLLPDDLPAYRRQRFRWAFGAFVILRKHRRAILSRTSNLTTGQRYHFIVGWAHWIGEGVALALAMLNVVWALVLAMFGIGQPPPMELSIAIVMIAVFNLVHGAIIQSSRRGVSLRAALEGVVIAMTLQMPIGRALAVAVARRDQPFVVTAKGGTGRRGTKTSERRRFVDELRPDALLATGLLCAAVALFATNRFEALNKNLFALVLVVQAIPFVVAVALGTAQYLASRHRAGQPTVLRAA